MSSTEMSELQALQVIAEIPPDEGSEAFLEWQARVEQAEAVLGGPVTQEEANHRIAALVAVPSPEPDTEG